MFIGVVTHQNGGVVSHQNGGVVSHQNGGVVSLIPSVHSRPSWDDWFMSLCFLVAQRSIDPATRHGCVVVDQEHTILSIGYNSPPRGCNDSIIPLTRPAKYRFLEHSEANSINNAARTGVSLKGSIFYITGHPCPGCLRKIINVGASKIIYGPVKSSCITDEDMETIHLLLYGQSIEMVPYKEWRNVDELLQRTRFYIDEKLNT